MTDIKLTKKYVAEVYQGITWPLIFSLLRREFYFENSESYSLEIFLEKINSIKKRALNNRDHSKVSVCRRLKFFLKRFSRWIKESPIRKLSWKFDRVIPKISHFQDRIIDVERRRVERILIRMGFTPFDSREIVTKKDNFDRLNIPKNHPSREDHCYFPLGNRLMLRSQVTSSHHSERLYDKFGKNFFSIGRAFRDDKDPTHLNAFHQVEWLIKSKLSLEKFLSLIKSFFSLFIGKETEIYIRPSYFPFTYASFEIDIKVDDNIYEVAGAGFMRKRITLQREGWPAMAFGLERLIMIKYKLKNILECYDTVENVT